MNRALRSVLARSKRMEREQVRGARYHLRHGQYVEAARSLLWAQQQQAFREGIEKASAKTPVVTRPDFPKRSTGRVWK